MADLNQSIPMPPQPLPLPELTINPNQPLDQTVLQILTTQ